MSGFYVNSTSAQGAYGSYAHDGAIFSTYKNLVTWCACGKIKNTEKGEGGRTQMKASRPLVYVLIRICIILVGLWFTSARNCMGYDSACDSECTPGDSRSCYCADGARGVQFCSFDEKIWQECECDKDDGGADSGDDACVDIDVDNDVDIDDDTDNDSDNDSDNDADGDSDADADGESGDLLWIKHIGGTGRDKGQSIAVLENGDFLLTGLFSSCVVFGSGECAESELTAAEEGNAYVARFKNDGSLVWVKQIRSTGESGGLAIKALSDESFYIHGSYRGTAVLGQGEDNETELAPYGDQDIFIASFNPDGTLAWAKRAGGPGTEYSNPSGPYGLDAKADGDVVFTGCFSDTAVFGEGDDKETSLTSLGNVSIFIARYDSDGALIWAKSAEGDDYNKGHGIGFLPDGSVMLSGAFMGRVTFGKGEGNQTVLDTVYNSMDIFLAMFDPDGSLVWVRQAGGKDSDLGHALALSNDGSVYISGKIQDGAIFGKGESDEITVTTFGENDMFLAKYSDNGDFIWLRHGGSYHTAHDPIEMFSGITVTPSGSILVNGSFVGGDHAVFGSGEPNETILESIGERDMLVAEYASDGSLLWARHAGGIARDHAYDSDVLSNNTAIVTGFFKETATFSPGEDGEVTLTSRGHGDIFLACYAR